jgi:hypothetical protein
MMMAVIRGTKQADSLTGTDENDTIYGLAGDDSISSSFDLGDDRIVGGGGRDSIFDFQGRNLIWAGAGDDTVSFARGIARLGEGDDSGFVSGGGWVAGNGGNDTVAGYGFLCGDSFPDGDLSVAGNDTLILLADADTARGFGGLGADYFRVVFSDAPGIGIVEDFTLGADKIGVRFAVEEGEDIDLFAKFDANHNGVLEWSDGLAGGGVYVNAATNTMFLIDGPSGAVIHGTTQIAAADWQF